MWARILWLDRKIRDGFAPSVTDLEEAFGIKRRTVFQTVAYLRDSLEAPIKHDRRRGGYIYTEPTYALPTVFFREGELLALLLAQEVTRQYLGSPLEAELRSALDKLQHHLPQGVEVTLDDLAETFEFAGSTSVAVSASLMADLRRAIRERRKVRMLYYTASRDATGERLIHPHFLTNVAGDWMLVSWDEERDQDRVFMLSRIREWTVLEQQFRPRPELARETYRRHAFRTEQGAAPEEVVLRFDAYQARWIRELVWHPSQVIEELPDGGLRLRLTVNVAGDLQRWILGYGSHVEVEAPPKLRERIADEHSNAAALYYFDVDGEKSMSHPIVSGL
jgi:predicted DNA-binding transcriptional regulator YafY